MTKVNAMHHNFPKIKGIYLFDLQGRNVDYTQQDESNRRWFNEFRSKATSTPIALDTVDGNHIWIRNETYLSHVSHFEINSCDNNECLDKGLESKKPVF